MTSLVRQEDGSLGFYFGDGLPFGHEFCHSALFDLSFSRNRRRQRGLLQQFHEALTNFNDSEDDAKDYIDSRFAEEAPNYSNLSFDGSKVEQLVELNPLDLSGFIKNHNRRFGHQEESLKAVDSTLKETVSENIEAMCEVDILPQKVKSSLEVAMQAAGVFRPMDSFEAGGMFADGYCTKHGQIYLANLFCNKRGFAGISDRMQNVAFHESVHAMGFLPELGFWNGLIDDESAALLEEPFVAHLTQLAADALKDPEILNPNERVNPTVCSYSTERTLLAAFDVSVEQLVAAYFSPRGEQSKARRGLADKLNRSAEKHFPALGDNAFYKLSEIYRRQSSLGRRRLVHDWLHLIDYAWLSEPAKEVDEAAVAAIKLVPVD